MKILVTGATGFVGRPLCVHLAQKNWLVRACIHSRPADFQVDGVEFASTPSIDGSTDWVCALSGVQAVVHLAARVHVMRETRSDALAAFRKINVEGTVRLATAASAAGIRRFIYLSSIKVNGERTSGRPFTEADLPDPEDPYGISKWEAEQSLWEQAARSGLEVVVLRPPMIYGPFVPGNFLRLLKLVQSGIPVPLASVYNQRSLVYVRNLCDAIAACLENSAAAGQSFLISDGEDVSTPDLMRLLAEALQRPSRLLPFPPPLLSLGAALFGFRQEAERLLGSLCVDSSKIRQVLGWNPPYSLRQGLRDTAAAYAGDPLN
jgi:nucleoside-diphosphate-sugar epimerase